MNQSEPDRDAVDPHVEELMVRYWDGTLDQRQLAELNGALVGRPELRLLFNNLGLQILAISERSAAEKACLPVATARPARTWRRRAFLWSTAAAGVLIVISLVTLNWPGRTDGPAIVDLENPDGDVFIDASDRPVSAKQALAAGQSVSTGLNSSAEIRCADGPRLILGGNTSVVMLDDKAGKIRVQQGDVAAHVRNRPLQIATPKVEVEARDAKLSLMTTAHQTVVSRAEQKGAPEGDVLLKRLADGQSIALQPGQELTVGSATDTPMQSKKASQVPDTFLMTFGRQLPPGWESGEIVRNSLPDDSEAAVRAVEQIARPGGIHFKVATQNAWTKGLFEIYDDSWFHVRFRVEKPGFFHVLIATRDADPTRRTCVVLEAADFFRERADGKFRQREPGKWYTVHLPFADFQSTKPGFTFAGLEKPLIAFSVNFDSQASDLGLTIERFWVTRGPEAP